MSTARSSSRHSRGSIRSRDKKTTTPSPVLLPAIGASGVGLLLHLVGMTTTYWSVHDSDKSIENFKVCISGRCVDIGNRLSDYTAVQAMTITGCLTGAAGFALALFCLLFNATIGKSANKHLFFLSAGAHIGAFVLIFIGVLVHGVEIDHVYDVLQLGYSLALSVLGSFLMLLAGVLLFASSIKIID